MLIDIQLVQKALIHHKTREVNRHDKYTLLKWIQNTQTCHRFFNHGFKLKMLSRNLVQNTKIHNLCLSVSLPTLYSKGRTNTLKCTTIIYRTYL